MQRSVLILSPRIVRTFAQGPKKQGCFICPEEVFLCDSCEKTEFGCCPDLQSAPAGPEFEGCPDEDGEIYEDCTLTEYGCCPDGLTRSKGLNFKGCDNATPCKDAKWGCCADLMNPAHGPDKEGCCLNTEFGCCPDNLTPAQGTDNKGCGCEFTEFGCCPDDSTTARGSGTTGSAGWVSGSHSVILRLRGLRLCLHRERLLPGQVHSVARA